MTFTNVLFPEWMSFAGTYLFLKIYNPTRLYLDNTTCLAIAICTAMAVFDQEVQRDLMWVVYVMCFAFLASVPFWLSGMLGSFIQQLLLLNEQSVQDRRFTDESEALSKLSSLSFLMFALVDGSLFIPLIQVIGDVVPEYESSLFSVFFKYIVDSMSLIGVVFAKYLLIMVIVTVGCGFVDLFFKKASMSLFIAPNIKAIIIAIILCSWFLQDQFYIFNQLID